MVLYIKPQLHFTTTTRMCQLAPVQGLAGQQYFNFLMSTAGAGLGPVPDWKRTAFWCNSSFVQASRMAHKLPPTQEAMAGLNRQRQ